MMIIVMTTPIHLNVIMMVEHVACLKSRIHIAWNAFATLMVPDTQHLSCKNVLNQTGLEMAFVMTTQTSKHVIMMEEIVVYLKLLITIVLIVSATMIAPDTLLLYKIVLVSFQITKEMGIVMMVTMYLIVIMMVEIVVEEM